MKVAISSRGTDLESSVGRRFGICPYLLIADLETGNLEAVRNPGSSAERAPGMQAVVLVLTQDVRALLTGYCSPAARQHLEANGVEVLTGLSGTAGEILQRYRMGEIGNRKEVGIATKSRLRIHDVDAWRDAMRRSCNQFASMLPILVGVVLLMGLFNTFLPRRFLASLFSGNAMLDTLWGACGGSIFAGNPINSYVIGGELLKHGVSLFAVTALIITWVTVGLVQLPAEMAALGGRFAILRNSISFVLSVPIAIITVIILNIATGGVR